MGLQQNRALTDAPGQSVTFRIYATGEKLLIQNDGVLSRSLPSGQRLLHAWDFARRNALAGASRGSNRLN